MAEKIITANSSENKQEIVDEIKKTKKLELKDSNSEVLEVEFNLRKKTITIQTQKKLSLNSPIYFFFFFLKKFQDCHKFFLHYFDIEEIFELIHEMKEEEFSLNYEHENLNLILKIEQRKKIIEIPIQLKKKELNINDSNKLIKEHIEILVKENQTLKNEFNSFKEKCLNDIEQLKIRINKLEKENEELKERNNNFVKYNNLLFSESKIIKDNEDKNFLINCLDNKKIVTKLIYSATMDGDTIDAFNKKCDGKSNTLSIIKTDNGKIIGGYFKKAFSVKENYYDPDCFLFSLNYKEKYNVDPNGKDKNYSFFVKGSVDAIIDFGIGSSIHITTNCLNDENNYYCGRDGTFKFPNNRITNSDTLFKVLEFEVYQITEIS